MSQKILQINGKLAVPPETFEQGCSVEEAQFLANIPGLLWKIWLLNRETGDAGGIYLFADEATIEDYIQGPVVAQFLSDPMWTANVKVFDFLPTPSAVTRAPVGVKLESKNGVAKTFNQMVEEALAEVPMVKPADAYRRQKKEPDLLVIDVRDAADIVETGTIPGAVNISVGSLTYKADHEVPEEWRDPLLADRSRPIITTCILGPLGAIGGGMLHEMGFTNVQILEGGVQAWIDAGLPIAK